MSDTTMLVEAMSILGGRCYGFSRYEGRFVPFSRKFLRRFGGAGCLYFIERGERLLENGFDSRTFSAGRSAHVLLPGGWHSPRLTNLGFTSQVREAGVFSLLTPYEIACIHELRGISLDGLQVRTPETHSLGLTGARLQYHLVEGRSGMLHFEKEYEGVASPRIGVMLGLRVEVTHE